MPEPSEISLDERYAAIAMDRTMDQLMVPAERFLDFESRDSYLLGARQLTALIVREGTAMRDAEIADLLGFKNEAALRRGITQVERNLGGEEAARDKAARIMEGIEPNDAEPSEELSPEEIDAAHIINWALDRFRITADELFEPRRGSRNIVDARHVVALTLREDLDLTYGRIGKILGYRTEPGARGSVLAIRERLGSGEAVQAAVQEVLDGVEAGTGPSEKTPDEGYAEQVMQRVTERFGLDAEAFFDIRRRSHGAAAARQLAVLIIREHTGLTYERIADMIGYKGDVPVSLAERSARKRLGSDEAVHQRIAKVMEGIEPPSSLGR